MEMEGAARVHVAPALKDEMTFFNQIMADHGRVLRGTLDLGEDALIREADRFVTVFEGLQTRLRPAKGNAILELALETHETLDELLAFKRQAQRLLSQCEIQAIFEPALVDHIRREGLWYQGMLARPLGRPAPRRRDLELPDGDTRAVLVLRGLIGRIPADLEVVSLEYDLFWLEIHAEHAMVLASHTRPLVQSRLRRQLEEWQRDLDRLRQEGARLSDSRRRREPRRDRPGRFDPAVARYNREVRQVVTRFRNFLVDLVEDLRHCRVPAGQANFWPSIAHHMRLEADYLLDALQRIDEAAGGRSPQDFRPNPFVEED